MIDKYEIIKQVEMIKEDAYKHGRFSLFHAKCLSRYFDGKSTFENMKWFYDLISGWDKYCNLSYEFGISLEAFINDPNIVVAMKRVYTQIDSKEGEVPISEDLASIMSKGLINYGHMNAMGGGAFLKVPDISLAMSPLEGLEGYIQLVGSYHSNNVVILAAFPKDIVDEDCHIVDMNRASEVYIMEDYKPTIKPDYLMGALVKSENGFDNFYTRNEIVEKNHSMHR